MVHALPNQPVPPKKSDFGSSFGSELPLVFVVFPETGTKLFDGAQDVTIFVIDNKPISGKSTPPNLLSDLSATAPLSAKMHVRGEATRADAKCQFAVKLDKAPKSSHFLGMKHGGKHWVFNDAGAVDSTYMRNPMAFHMERNLDTKSWAPRTRYFELFLATGSSVSAANTKALIENAYEYYQGIYINMEKIRKEKHRIDISKYTLQDPSGSDVGDLILQANHTDSKYVSLNGPEPSVEGLGVEQIICYEPNAKYFGILSSSAPPTIPTPPPAQLEPILDWWRDWAGTVAFTAENSKYWTHYNGAYTPNQGFAGTTGISGQLQQQFDYPSFAAYFLMAEIAKDPDGYHRSTFMWKKGNTVHAGPMWDKNKSYGNVPLLGAGDWYTKPKGWTIYQEGNPMLPVPARSESNPINSGQAPGWWTILLTDPTFCMEVWKIWTAETQEGGAFHLSTIEDHVKLNRDLLKSSGAAARDLALWGTGLTVTAWENLIEDPSNSGTVTLFSYLKARISWIETNLASLLLATSGYAAPVLEDPVPEHVAD